MWVFTVDGYYSAVKSKTIPEGAIMIRSRKKVDLVRLLSKMALEKTKIIMTPQADYLYRVVVPVEAWAIYLARAAYDINYSNFKNASCANDPERHDAYMGAWASMLRFQHDGFMPDFTPYRRKVKRGL